MTNGQVIIILARIIVPLIILRRPLAGGIIAMLLDALDVVLVELFGPGGMGDHYHTTDKLLDLWYLGLEAWVAWSWTARIPRLVAIGLFAWRVVGVALFEITNLRWMLFAFPNLFENWFLFVLIVWKWFPQVRLDTWKHAITWLVILYIPKLGQEYLLHVSEAQPWDWIKRQFDW
ncbi:MAG TPA: hypothetical protein VD789_07600 [Thermomicrobiales bacterium]|nr:hypothetical protein [Thermomicrobiales bacterium]